MLSCLVLTLLVGIVNILYGVVPVIVRSTIAKAQLAFRSVNIEQIEKDRFRLRGELELSQTGSLPGTILAPLVITVDDVGAITYNQPISITGDSSRPTVVSIRDCHQDRTFPSSCALSGPVLSDRTTFQFLILSCPVL